MKYRIGKPLWKVAYAMGATLYYRVVIRRDPTEGTYYAASSDIPCLLAEGETIAELISNIKECVALLAKQYYPQIKNIKRLVLVTNLKYVSKSKRSQFRKSGYAS